MSVSVGIVGAGVAGLMAALDLSARGHQVTVFEARPRVGGRVHTVRFADGRFANAGAEWLNSSDTVARELTDRYGLELVERYGFEAVVAEGSPFLGDGSYPGIDEAFESATSALTDLENPWDDPAARDLDRLSVAEWAYGTGADSRTIDRFFRDFEGEFMAPVVQISMAAAAISSLLTNNDRAFRLRDGTASLPEAMADELGRRSIHLDETVVAVSQTPDLVTVSTAHATHHFDAVVLALPLPALGRIQIAPALDLPWIGQGRGGKLLVPYDNAALDGVAQPSPETGQKFVYVSASHQPGDGVILTAYSDQILDPEEVTATFGRWFPELTRSSMEPVAAWWSLDALSGTTYSAPQPGYLDALRRLRQPQSRIYLAGEHTEILFGYVESGLMSGRRVAHQIDSATTPARDLY